MYEKMKHLVQACPICQRGSRRRYLRQNPAHPIPTPDQPFFLVGCDAVGTMYITPSGNRYLLVAVEYLKTWPIALPVKSIDRLTTAQFLFNEVVCRHGIPQYILTDRGSNYTSGYVKTFLNTLSKICLQREDTSNWDNYVNQALLAIRTMPSDVSRHTPAKLLYGYEIRTPAAWPAPRQDYVEGDIGDELVSRIKVIDHAMRELWRSVQALEEERKRKFKARYDREVYLKTFELGDAVLMRDHVPAGKLEAKWICPLTVTRVNRNGTYHLAGPFGSRLSGAVNGDALKPWVERTGMVPEVVTARQAEKQLQAFRQKILLDQRTGEEGDT